MDFVLGILTGIVLMIVYSQWLSDRQYRRRIKETERLTRAFHENMQNLRDTLFPPQSLEQRLKDALDREDYEEAERIRNLMNKR